MTFENEPYYKFNREERHLAAILFYLLQTEENVHELLNFAHCGDWPPIVPEQFGIYFEYSYLRDQWDRLGRDTTKNGEKRLKITQMLNDASPSRQFKTELPIDNHAFNQFFIVRGSGASKNYIQSPANWRLPTLKDNLSNQPSDLIAACKVKWSFKCKPDLVVHTDLKHALCIELKLLSPVASYPCVCDPPIFFGPGKENQNKITQTELQKFMMTTLLGLEDCRFLVVSLKASKPPEQLSWKELLSKLKYVDHPSPYITYVLDKLKAGTWVTPAK
jgi:hypothetical protein